jgi:hypothetical protein
MTSFRFILAVLAFSCAQVSARESQGVIEKVRLNVNPIRRVVTMLQNMQKKVAEEGKKEEELFDKFMCYCKNGKGALQASIETAKNTND